MRVTVVLGTRPEVIKLAPVVANLRGRGAEVRVVHTGQHTDSALATGLESECRLSVDARWQLPDDSAARLGHVFEYALKEFASFATDAAIVLGDTWTVPLIGMAARSYGVPVVHVEAGLRSHNLRSQEEVNRRAAVACARLHLAPTTHAARALRGEGVAAGEIVITGNPVTDALRATGLAIAAPGQRRGVLFTAHRASNVDDPDRLSELATIVEHLTRHFDHVTFPMHPRTRARAEAFGLTDRFARHCDVVEPLGYRALLDVLRMSTIVVTDSGGLQEEAAWFKVPAVVMRATTPRPEGIDAQLATLCGVDHKRVMTAATQLTTAASVEHIMATPCPYGDGHAAPRIASAIASAFVAGRLQLREPELHAAA